MLRKEVRLCLGYVLKMSDTANRLCMCSFNSGYSCFTATGTWEGLGDEPFVYTVKRMKLPEIGSSKLQLVALTIQSYWSGLNTDDTQKATSIHLYV